MPTHANCQRLESVTDAATNLIELKRVLDKVNLDIEVLKNRLQLREDGGDSASVADATEMDDRGDTAEPEGENGRSQSVLSARSTRSRKHVSFFSFLESNTCLNRCILRPVVQCPSLP